LADQSITYGFNFFTNLAKDNIRVQFSILQRRFGIQTKIYLPKSSETVYGQEDVKFIYDKDESESRKCLISGLLRESSKALQMLDPFYMEEIVWYDATMTTDYPNGTLLVCELGRDASADPPPVEADQITFKIDHVKQQPGGSDPIIKRYVLVQAS
jgi:hypothetical protein